MREILFRGKRDGGWLKGWFVETPLGNYAIRLYSLKNGMCYADDYVVDPETVGQYTGLTDKNGKRIFEGDIVSGALWWLEKQKNGVVTFRNGSFGLLWYRGEIEQFNAFTSMCNIMYEIIGNIHDNPELLKGGEADV